MRDVEKLLEEQGYEDVIVLKNPSYDSAFIGVSTDNQAVYGYNKMVEFLVENDGMTEEEAADFISYNTLRALPYMGEHHPIVIQTISEND